MKLEEVNTFDALERYLQFREKAGDRHVEIAYEVYCRQIVPVYNPNAYDLLHQMAERNGWEHKLLYYEFDRNECDALGFTFPVKQ